jgi:hypothetical protein
VHTPITDKGKFWQLSPAATKIFQYVAATPEISQSPWGFDSGNIADDLNSSHAGFSCVTVSGWGRDKLFVQATRQVDGSWSIHHTITRAA